MFQLDSLFNKKLTKLFDLCLLNILFLITSLPVITIGASLSALYAVTLSMSKDQEGPVLKMYFHEWKQNLKKGMIAGLFFLLIFGLLLFDIWVWKNSQSQYRAMFITATLVLIGFVTMIAAWVFPLIAKFENSVKNMFKNAALFSLKYFIVSFSMSVVTIGYLLLVMEYILVAWPFVLLLGAVVLAYPWTFYINCRFEQYLNTDKQSPAVN